MEKCLTKKFEKIRVIFKVIEMGTSIKTISNVLQHRLISNVYDILVKKFNLIEQVSNLVNVMVEITSIVDEFIKDTVAYPIILNPHFITPKNILAYNDIFRNSISLLEKLHETQYADARLSFI